MRIPALLLPSVFLVALVPSTASAQHDHGPAPSAMAERCGSGIAWKDSLDAALALARESRRPVFWYVPTVPGSPMDRKPEVDMYMRAGMLSMPDIVTMVNRRCVPYRGAPTREQAKTYDLKPLKYIEPGFVLLSPDGKIIGKVAPISTYHELWLTQTLDQLLQAAGELGRPSDAAAAATDPLAQAEQHLLDGAWHRAEGALAKVDAAADAKKRDWIKGRLLARTGDAAGAEAALTTIGTPEAQVELGLLALRREDWPKAIEILLAVKGGDRAAEGQYYLGVAQSRAGHQPDAKATWLKIGETTPDSPWAAKAAAEVERHGPFSRAFEEYGYLPKDAITAQPLGTQRERQPADVPMMVARSVKYLLERQNPDGSYDDSNYDFGGRASLPDVYAACTAICANALLDWRSAAPDKIDGAVKRAFDYLADESHIATEDEQERVWAHSYRILFFCRLLATQPPYAEKVKAKLGEVVKLTQGIQKKKGIYAHEYPNPFATATAIHALSVAKKSGAEVKGDTIETAAAALASTRGKDGAFSYGYPGKGDRDAAFAGGRGPICELALLLAGKSSQEALAAAIDTSFKEHAALEQPRKYDDHSPPHRIGGFFFWYDMHTRCLAIDSLAKADQKRALFDKQLALIASISEIDGRFIDSHELGKPYGTAMALLCLKMCGATMP